MTKQKLSTNKPTEKQSKIRIRAFSPLMMDLAVSETPSHSSPLIVNSPSRILAMMAAALWSRDEMLWNGALPESIVYCGREEKFNYAILTKHPIKGS